MKRITEYEIDVKAAASIYKIRINHAELFNSLSEEDKKYLMDLITDVYRLGATDALELLEPTLVIRKFRGIEN